MVKITAKYSGSLRVEVTHGPTGATIVTTAPQDKGGTGESFSPTDVCAAALCACATTNMGFYAKTRGLDIAGTTVEIKRTMSAEPPSRIARLELEFIVPDRGFSDKDTLGFERAAKTCPVHNSLSPEIEE